MAFAACDNCNITFSIDHEDPHCPDCSASLRILSREEALSRIRQLRGQGKPGSTEEPPAEEKRPPAHAVTRVL
jgi:hypothetical protein